jgi:hypothetical protein
LKLCGRSAAKFRGCSSVAQSVAVSLFANSNPYPGGEK